VRIVNCDFTPAQRLLALGITASTLQLVRSLGEGRGVEQLKGLMSERRRMLRELEAGPVSDVLRSHLTVLGAAVEESDRTVEALTC
jgi:hypothetical protein